MPRGGLCNYLRCIFSCYRYAKSTGQKLVVIWEVTPKCNGYFLDYFEPVENIEFVKNNQRKYKIDLVTFGEHPAFGANYEKLKVRQNIKDVINERRNKLGNNYISVHIRRTDHITLAQKNNSFTTDEEFIHFIDTNKTGKNLYIAADNKETYDSFRSRYSDLVKFNYHNVIAGPRNTELLDAVIDMFMCVFSDHFMGSGYSSFSGLIVHLRTIFKRDILEPPKLIIEDNPLYNKISIEIPPVKLAPPKLIVEDKPLCNNPPIKNPPVKLAPPKLIVEDKPLYNNPPIKNPPIKLAPQKLIMEAKPLYNKPPIKIPPVKLAPHKKIKNINKIKKGLYRELDIRFYRNNNPDIKNYTDNQLILHYVNYGKREGRLPSAR